MDKIIMREMRFWSHVGCLDFEKVNGQEFVIDAVLGFDEIRGCYTDELDDTCDYSKVYEEIEKVVTGADCDLIERLAQMIADVIFKTDERVSFVKVKVSKPDAPIDGKLAAMEVEIERHRNG